MGQLKNILDEDRNKGVLTTKSIASLKKEITYVVYDEDGDWQFFDDDDFDENEVLLVSLEQILKIDSTLYNFPNIEKNETFIRDNKTTEWQKLQD